MTTQTDFRKYAGRGRSSHERLEPKHVVFLYRKAEELGYKPEHDYFPKEIIESFNRVWPKHEPKLNKMMVSALLRHMRDQKLRIEDFLD